jgi:hypothetical protein
MMTSSGVTSFVLLVLSSATQPLITVSKGKDVGTAKNNPLYFKFTEYNGINQYMLTSYIQAAKNYRAIFNGL